ncbi:hypothetical protein PCIT_a2966 [Pseudoalteromonas citrea]|uniref:Uncharacterized protein n=2 Tax=Pseudoalteromonas citrea TaxID=43655 RepID=A0AAD4AHV6_9GAMM|nr:hypothetical protein [Pseudoalteromonas citrea]KAF7770022.1 hypothetical protein PCIT_a2966 [Pseudoalteromonas citrea]
MTIEAGLTQLQVDVAELADTSQSLAKSVTSSLAEIDAVKGDIQNTHNFVDSNYQAMNDWQTKHGTVTFKNLQGQNKQVNTLSKLILDSEKINPNPHVMSKAQFDALRELRKQQYAGSGFIEWGKHWAGSGADGTVNEGLWPYFKEMRWGRRNNVSDAGSSHSGFPIAVIDGVSHLIKGTALNATEAANNIQIQFPPAPDGTKTYDSATGVITEHASAAQAFEGVIDNGDFRNGDDGSWSKDTGWTITTGEASVTGSGPNTSIAQSKPHDASTQYTFSFSAKGAVGGESIWVHLGNAGPTEVVITDQWTNYSVTRLPTGTGQALQARGTDSFSVRDISYHVATEQVITSRKDLVFLETWHEKISDKDLFVPLGNVQYGATSFGKGMALNKLTDYGIAQGYCAFGEWDTITQGYGRRWSEMSEARKKEMIDNPENNIYYDSEADELIQVRYRIRVVEGLGDDWATITPYKDSGGGAMRYGDPNSAQVAVRGNRSTSMDYGRFSNNNAGRYHDQWNAAESQLGRFRATAPAGPYEGNTSNAGCEGKCFAIPVALVQRMNQGAYHPTYNPMGCSLMLSGDMAIANKWYHPSVFLPTSTLDCFTFSQGAGNIGGGSTRTGRADQYEFYDAIYAGQVEDLRLNANKLDVNQLREESMRKAVAGEMRGKGKVPFWGKAMHDNGNTFINKSLYYADAYHFVVYGPNITNTYGMGIGDIFWIKPKGSSVWIAATIYEEAGSFIRATTEGVSNVKPVDDLGVTAGVQLASEYWKVNETTSEFDSLPWVDIIGDPERIAATFPDGVIGQWVPVVPTA